MNSNEKVRWTKNIMNNLIKECTFEAEIPIYICAQCGSRIGGPIINPKKPDKNWRCSNYWEREYPLDPEDDEFFGDDDIKYCDSAEWKIGIMSIREKNDLKWLNLWHELSEAPKEEEKLIEDKPIYVPLPFFFCHSDLSLQDRTEYDPEKMQLIKYEDPKNIIFKNI
jgi:hypothetical protein